MIRIQEILDKVAANNHDANLELIQKAYVFAATAHAGQTRLSGEPYLSHPLAVAYTLADMGFDEPTVAAGLLHDTVEDTGTTIEEIDDKFGEDVADIVDGVTKISMIVFENKEEAQAENIRKMILAMSHDMRVLMVKLADRLHNMSTLDFQKPHKQRRIAQETMDIYAPLANRLGLYLLKRQLEDLSFKYLRPDIYNQIDHWLDAHQVVEKQIIEKVVSLIQDLLASNGLEGQVYGRIKHKYSIYKKMKRQNKTLDQIYDLTAVRIIVDTVDQCYELFGKIHQEWKPIPGRIKDYIATPKENMYQSLHTTVVTNIGKIFEIQIRTKEMNRTAEYGIAAHWKYKENKENTDAFDKRLSWIREVMEWQGGLNNSTEFLESLKGDLYNNEVLVFTPKGEVISLVKDATPIDYAYRIHTEVGNKCVGAKVNGKMVPLTTTLCTGDVVEIITSKLSKGPSWDWLKIAKSSGAKAKIKAFYKKAMQVDNEKLGKSMLDSEAKNRGYSLGELLNPVSFERISQKLSVSSPEEMYAAVGCGAITINSVLLKLIDFHKKEIPVPEKIAESKVKKVSENVGGVKIKGMSGLLVRFAGCCNPVPGDDIVGFVSRGRGVTVHRRDCPNMKNEDPGRLLEAEWVGDQGSYSVSIRVVGGEDAPILVCVSNACTELGLMIVSVNGRIDAKNHQSIVEFTIKLGKKEDLDLLINKVNQNSCISDIFRI